MDRLDELAVLVAIVDHGSLAAAGRQLRRSPPVITRTLAGLEDRVGARLVERTTRKAVPTEAGRRLAEQARSLLAGYDQLSREAAEAPLRGRLRVTAPVVFGRRHVTPLVAAFLREHPALAVELVLADRNLDFLEEGLDVAVRIGPLTESGLVARRVGSVGRVLVASPDYLAANGAPAHPGDLGRHEIVFASSRPMPLEWRFRNGLRQRAVRLAPRLEINDVEASLLAARAGAGITMALSYQVADDLERGALIRLLAEWEMAAVPVHLVAPGGRHMAPRVRAFLDYAVDSLKALDVLRDKDVAH